MPRANTRGFKRRKLTSTVTSGTSRAEVIRYLASIGLMLTEAAPNGDCFPLSAMAGHKISAQQAVAPDDETHTKVRQLRNDAVDTITGSAPIGVVDARIVHTLQRLPGAPAHARRAMARWRELGSWRSAEGEEPLPTAFMFAVALQLGRTVMVLEAKGGGYLSKAALYGERDATSALRRTKGGTSIDNLYHRDMAEALHLLTTHPGDYSVVNYDRIGLHFTPFVPPPRSAASAERGDELPPSSGVPQPECKAGLLPAPVSSPVSSRAFRSESETDPEAESEAKSANSSSEGGSGAEAELDHSTSEGGDSEAESDNSTSEGGSGVDEPDSEAESDNSTSEGGSGFDSPEPEPEPESEPETDSDTESESEPETDSDTESESSTAADSTDPAGESEPEPEHQESGHLELLPPSGDEPTTQGELPLPSAEPPPPSAEPPHALPMGDELADGTVDPKAPESEEGEAYESDESEDGEQAGCTVDPNVPEAEEDEPDEPDEPNAAEPGPPALSVQLPNLHPASPAAGRDAMPVYNPASPDLFLDQTKAAAVLLGLDSPAPTANFFRMLKFAVDPPFESILFGFRFKVNLRPTGERHWTFQGRLAVEGGVTHFTSCASFPQSA